MRKIRTVEFGFGLQGLLADCSDRLIGIAVNKRSLQGTGGLADSVVDVTPLGVRECTATGFVFENAWPELLACLLRALLLCRDRGTWRQVRSQAVQRGFGWAASAVRYLELYRVLLTDGCSR